MSLFPPAPRRATDPKREAPALPQPIPQNPSPWARLGRWLFDRITRR
ncbi:hypothetical protein [Methylobacterium sp. Leaf108]|nr:hypothetical protein [Methylobacterium sp. Leaf108]